MIFDISECLVYSISPLTFEIRLVSFLLVESMRAGKEIVAYQICHMELGELGIFDVARPGFPH